VNALRETPLSPTLPKLASLRGRLLRLAGLDPEPPEPARHLRRHARHGAARNWAYLLTLAPLITDWLETGSLPKTPASYITELVVGGIIAACVGVIHRDMDRLDAMAHTDALTGLPNRRRFTADLEHEIALVNRLGIALTLVFVDIDNFKRINDTLGHHEGDAVLRSVARLIQHRARRAADMCYRIGGDEFVVLLPGIDAGHALDIVRGCCETEGTRTALPSHYGVSLSCGAAQLRKNESCTEFMRRADALMYDAKHRARRRVGDGPT
jgi:diguanylate cyclase (GGDEF)-like protein